MTTAIGEEDDELEHGDAVLGLFDDSRHGLDDVDDELSVVIDDDVSREDSSRDPKISDALGDEFGELELYPLS